MYLMLVEAPDIAEAAQPGQFVTVRCGDLTLRRPFSIHQASGREIGLLFKVVGRGTLWLSRREKGDKLDILGPLGTGFDVEPGARNLLLVAGGVGIAPLVFLAQRAALQHRVVLVHAVGTGLELYPDKHLQTAIGPDRIEFLPVTEDGSVGEKGLATEVLPKFLEWADQVFACGPLDMYRAMAGMSSGGKPSSVKLKRCQLSLEVRLGCGLGACYGCTIETKKGLKRVCRDGPVFELDDIKWQEVTV